MPRKSARKCRKVHYGVNMANDNRIFSDEELFGDEEDDDDDSDDGDWSPRLVSVSWSDN